MNFDKIGFWLHIWEFYVVTVVQKKNQNYYWWTLVDPNKGYSYTESSTG